MRAALRFGLAAVVVASSLSAQVKESITVNLVEVPVTVVDRNGNPVRGLTAANFEIYDSGTKRDITNFDAIDFAKPEVARGISPLNPVARRTFLIVFDLSFAQPQTVDRAKEAARRFISRTLQRRDIAAIATVDADKGFRVLTSFTTDRNLLMAAVADPQKFKGSDPLQIAAVGANEISSPQLAGTNNTSGGKGDEDYAYDLQRQQQQLDLEYRRNRIEKQMNALEGLAKTLRNIPGRKELVLLSEGFDPSVIRGRDVRNTTDEQTEMEEILHGNMWRVNSDERYGSASGMWTLDRMAKAFRGSDVVLNAIDIRGIRLQNDVQSGSTISSNDALYLLARPTGGMVIDNSNDLSLQFDRMMHSQEVVYVLAFRAPTKHPGQFHDLKVKLVDVSGGRAFHRAGYFESGGESAVEKTLSTAQIVINDLSQTDVPINAITAAFPSGGAKSMVPVVLEIDGAGLVKDLRGNSAGVEIYVYAFDEDGNVRDTLFQKMTLDLRKLGAKLRAGGVKYYGTLALPPGKYAVRSLVRVVDTDRKGFTRTDLVVPGPNDVALLPPLFPDLDVNRWIVVRGTEHDKGAFPFTISSEPFLPTVHVTTGPHRRFTVFAFNASPDEVTWETSPKATLIHQERDPQSDMVKAVFQIDSVGADTSHIDVTLHRKGSAETRTASLPIIVR